MEAQSGLQANNQRTVVTIFTNFIAEEPDTANLNAKGQAMPDAVQKTLNRHNTNSGANEIRVQRVDGDQSTTASATDTHQTTVCPADGFACFIVELF